MEFGLKERDGELLIRVSYLVPKGKKQKMREVLSDWKLIAILLTSLNTNPMDQIIVIEPENRDLFVSINADNNLSKKSTTQLTHITIAQLTEKNNLLELIPQISLAISKLDQLVEKSK